MSWFFPFFVLHGLFILTWFAFSILTFNFCSAFFLLILNSPDLFVLLYLIYLLYHPVWLNFPSLLLIFLDLFAFLHVGSVLEVWGRREVYAVIQALFKGRRGGHRSCGGPWRSRLICKYSMYKVQHMDQISIKTQNPKSRLFLKID